jgi:hypothetical protein
MASVAVVIPYGGDDPHRAAAAAHVRAFYRYEFPDWQVAHGFYIQEPFSRARAVNAGIAATDAEIVIVNDADTLCPPSQVREAVRLAEERGGLVRAYTRYRRLSAAASEACVTYKDALAAPDESFEWEQDPAYAHGCAVAQAKCWKAVGGYDPRFEGWGYEDCAAELIFNALWPDRRVPGDLVHLWHPGGWTVEDEHRNSKLYHELYERNAGSAASLIAARFSDE